MLFWFVLCPPIGDLCWFFLQSSSLCWFDWLIDWCLTPTLAVFHPYSEVNKFPSYIGNYLYIKQSCCLEVVLFTKTSSVTFLSDNCFYNYTEQNITPINSFFLIAVSYILAEFLILLIQWRKHGNGHSKFLCWLITQIPQTTRTQMASRFCL